MPALTTQLNSKGQIRWLAPLALLLAALFTGQWANRALAQDGESASAVAQDTQRGSVQVVLVRHAEKELDQGSDPALTPGGRERALRLRDLFAHSGATRFFASQFQRTQKTLEPWAELSGGVVEVAPAQDPEALVELLRDLPAGTLAAVAGHSNTIPDLVQRLGGSLERLNPRGWLPDDEYSRLFVVTIPVGEGKARPVTLLELSF